MVQKLSVSGSAYGGKNVRDRKKSTLTLLKKKKKKAEFLDVFVSLWIETFSKYKDVIDIFLLHKAIVLSLYAAKKTTTKQGSLSF